jgi:hypothetical protein
MLFREEINFYFENQKEHLNTLCIQNAEVFNVLPVQNC